MFDQTPPQPQSLLVSRFLLPHLHATDSTPSPPTSHLGKSRRLLHPPEVDLLTLTQHTLWPHHSWNRDVQACMWAGVICDVSGEIPTELRWAGFLLHGNLTWEALPRTTRRVILSNNMLGGTLDLTALHDIVEFFSVSYNRLGGTLELRELPPNIATLNVAHNRFTGGVDLRMLPNTLTGLFLQDNYLSGVAHIPSDPDARKNRDPKTIDLTLNPNLIVFPDVGIIREIRYDGSAEPWEYSFLVLGALAAVLGIDLIF